MSAVQRAILPVHPGLPQQPRRIVLPASGVRSGVARIEAREELFAFAQRLAEGFDGSAAVLRFAALPMHPIAIHVPEPDPTGRQIMRYGEAVVFDEACELVSAQMTVGIDASGPVLHCHGHILRGNGERFGGHFARGQCFVAPGVRPVDVGYSVLEGARLERVFDTETGFDLMSPVAGSTGASTASRGWLLRLKPDEDLVGALLALGAEHGASRLRVIGAVGSLTGAALVTPEGRAESIDGPGLEIVTLAGELDCHAPDRASPGSLCMVVADNQGQVHLGRPVAGGNPICVTIELFVEALP